MGDADSLDSAGIAVSALGLSLVTSSDHTRSRPDPSSSSYSSTRTSSRDMSLTATAVFTFSANSNSSPSYRLNGSSEYRPYALSSPTATNTTHSAVPFSRSVSENAALSLKTPTDPARPGTISKSNERRRSFADLDDTLGQEARPPNRHIWLRRRRRRRLSNSMSSRESSRPPSSRPTSAAVSHSNGSIAFSNAPSTTPFLPSSADPASHSSPNKLVKRSTSVRSFSNQPSSTSKLPRPTFKRPATSHQRSSLSQRPSSDTDQIDLVTNEQSSVSDAPWRPYFIPKVTADAVLSGRTRASSIPNPIKRVFPDRRYRPVLLSAREPVARVMVEVDDGFSSPDGSLVDLGPALQYRIASSPIPSTNTDLEQAPNARRSFSIGDLLSTGPQPLWKSSSSTRGGRVLRRSRRRISSTSNSDMGSVLSFANTTDSERPYKRREISRSDDVRGSRGEQSNVTAGRDTSTLIGRANIPQRQFTDALSSAGRSSSQEIRTLSPSPAIHSAAHQARGSLSTPDFTDAEFRSFSDSNTDDLSDVLFDSIPTRTTRSSSGRRGPPIDTIFDDTPPSYSSGRSTKLKDYLNQEDFVVAENPYRYSTIEEEESIATPVRSLRNASITSSPTARGTSRSIFSSSPPTMQAMTEPEAINWDAFNEPAVPDAEVPSASAPFSSQMRGLPLRFAPALKQAESSSSTPMRNGTGHPSIFDWAEAQPSPSQHSNQSPPRPRTVHGKKDPENRSSRTTTRRTPSAMHARSHSVPVVPDGEAKRSVGHNKFGTWGVGSKAVTEDWNEDFEFDDVQPQLDQSMRFFDSTGDKRIDSGHEMLIPVAIQEQQQNVVANIGLLREWGLLIEELKELRMRAVALNMLTGIYAQAWTEVDAMIELADQETEERTLEPRRSPPSSPDFDYNAFEDALPDHNQALDSMTRLPEPLIPPLSSRLAPQTTLMSPSRPRKDSEAVARSVIEALQQRRTANDHATSASAPSPAKKVPFDTATLRHIVPYVSNLRGRVKDALRETEGLYKSPVRSKNDLTRAGAQRDGSPAPKIRDQHVDSSTVLGLENDDDDYDNVDTSL